MTQTDAPAVQPANDAAGRCPVMNIQWEGPPREALSGHQMLDGVRHTNPIVKVPDGMGFFLVSSHEEALQVAQDAETFPQPSRSLTTGEESQFELVPETLNGPIHTKWRRLLGSYFSPGRVNVWDDQIRARANLLIDGFVDRGECDFTAEFALRYPTGIFLEFMGLPVDELEDLLKWETAILHPDYVEGESSDATRYAAQAEVTNYFIEVVAKRRAMPRAERPAGLVTEALDWTIDGEPVTDGDLLSFYLLMFMAGLDTVTAELGYGFLHLATHPDDRRQLVERPELIPNATEELLRLYPIVNVPREASRDTEIAGCPVKKGEFVIVSYPSAGRDESAYPDSLTADFERVEISHLTFGAGPHRCLGSHLARHELMIAYQEWHKRIPEYWLNESLPSTEATGGMMTLNSLPLQWKR
ncbi:cytochrome P450 [Jatrophihabitans sp. DSM 45814]